MWIGSGVGEWFTTVGITLPAYNRCHAGGSGDSQSGRRDRRDWAVCFWPLFRLMGRDYDVAVMAPSSSISSTRSS
jgi:hypothetical protein